MDSSRQQVFVAMGPALLRAATLTSAALPAWPTLTGADRAATDSWRTWLRKVWNIADVAEAVQYASPVLAETVSQLHAGNPATERDLRRVVLAVMRYLLRMVGRATPFGVMAGVAPAAFGRAPRHEWGQLHTVIARPSAPWLSQVIASLEHDPKVVSRIRVVTNSTLMVRGDRLVVPYQPQAPHAGRGAVDVSMRCTPAVRLALASAHAPIAIRALTDQLQAEFPTVPATTVTAMLTTLVEHAALLTTLHAPSTETDPLAHLVAELAASAEDDTPTSLAELQAIQADVEQHNQAKPDEARTIRIQLGNRMRHLAHTDRSPLALDLRVDAQTVLPDQIAGDIGTAAAVLTRLSPFPVGTPSWRAYHQRFYERYGIGSLPRLLDVLSDSGIGWPDGYPGTVTPERRSPASSRDEALLALAQQAALDGRVEVVLDDATIDALALTSQPLRPPPHLEVGVRVRASNADALTRGHYLLEVTSVSRAAGTLIGRFLSVLNPDDANVLTAALSAVRGVDADTVAAQLSFPPLDPATGHVTRAPQIRPLLVSLAEPRLRDDRVLTLADLAVGCDGRRLYLAVPERGVRIEATTGHALNLRTHTPPLARLLIELSRAQNAQVTTFDWGAAARLPFLPRLRYGRIILAPAHWRLAAPELPGATEPFTAWDDALATWRIRRRLPRRVFLAEGDQRLLLDLDQQAHRVLLRSHLDSRHADAGRHVELAEAPSPEDSGWCGGRAHEVVVPLVATTPAPWPALPRPTVARVIGPDHHQTPGVSPVLLACLYSDPHRQDALVTEHLPGLVARLDQAPWWFLRYRDPDHHLRLRIALPDPAAFGPFASAVGQWADELRHRGLLRELVYRTSYPELGRWGSGHAWTYAEATFRADSAAVLTQLRQPARPHRQALTAAHSVAIAVAFTGDTAAGLRWLIEHVPASAPARVPRPVFSEAVRLADPHNRFAALRAAPGGDVIVNSWVARDQAVADYRARLVGPDAAGIALDDVLGSLLHAHFVRAVGIDFDDEAVVLYLARCAALAWQARSEAGTR